MREFHRGFQLVADTLGNKLAGQETQDYVVRVDGAIDQLVEEMGKLVDNDKGLLYAKGDLFEAWHAYTLNLDAVRRGLDVHASVPRDHSPIDVRVTSLFNTIDAQLKDCRTAEDTARAISNPKYQDMDQKIVPSDQMDAVREITARLALKNQLTRPEMEESYSHTAKVTDDRLRLGGASGRPLSEFESRQLTQQLRADGDVDREGYGLTPEQVIQWEDFLRETSTAAIRAAALSAAIQMAPHIAALVLKALKAGELTLKDLVPMGKQVPSAVLRSGLSGGLTASIIAAARMGTLGGAFKDLDPTMVAACVALSITTIGTSIKAAQGIISWQVAGKTMVEDSLVLACAMGCATAAGQFAIPIPLLGAVIGNIVGAIVARLVIAKANEVMLGVAADTGWTFFGMVCQDYSIPDSIFLQEAWDSLKIELLHMEELRVEELEIDELELDHLEVEEIAMEPITAHILRRGVISFGRVGYSEQ